MDPSSLAVGAVVLVLVSVMGIAFAWWMIRTTVNLLKRLIALALVMGVAGMLLLVAAAAFLAHP